MRDLLASDPDFGHTMLALISDAAENFSLVNEWEMGPNPSGALDLPTDSSEPTLVFFQVQRVNVDDGHEGEGGEVILDLTIRGEAQIDFFAPKWSAFSEDAEFEIEDGDWNEWMVWASASRDLDLQVTVSYSAETHELANPDILGWEAVERIPEA